MIIALKCPIKTATTDGKHTRMKQPTNNYSQQLSLLLINYKTKLIQMSKAVNSRVNRMEETI